MKVCSKCKQELPVTDFGADSRKKDGLKYICRKCEAVLAKAYRKKWAANPELVEKRRLWQKEYRKKRAKSDPLYNKKASAKMKRYLRRRKRWAVDELGGACVVCGLRCEATSVYDFHHFKEKRNGGRTLSQLLSNKSKEFIKKELSKCVLLCANCHRLVHSNDIDLGSELYSFTCA